MALTITHPFVSPVVDDSDPNEVGPDEWNAAHTLSGTLPNANGGYTREILTADRTYYVRTDGSDSNDGLTDSSGGAFLTIQKAADVVTTTLDLNGDPNITVKIKIADGTYSASNVFGNLTNNPEDIINNVHVRCAVVEGNTSTPGNVILSGITPIQVSGSLARWQFKGVRVQPTGNFGVGAAAIQNGYMVLDGVQVGMSGGTFQAGVQSFNGGKTVVISDISFEGNGSTMLGAFLDAVIDFEPDNLTMVSTPNYTFATVFASEGAAVRFLYLIGVTGTATGSRYYVDTASEIQTFGGGATYIPGDTAGTANAADGGFYL